MNKNFFKATKDSPFHISVGAVLTDEQGRVCCHFHKKEDLPFESEGKHDVYMLMRETLEPGETIESAVLRGVKEEFGAEGEITHYLGSIVSHFPLRTSRVEVQKTTLYFHVLKTNINLSWRDPVHDMEARSTILWLEAEELERLFVEQGRKYQRTDLDESQIMKHYIKYIRDRQP